jgi:hypothetical protein
MKTLVMLDYHVTTLFGLLAPHGGRVHDTYSDLLGMTGVCTLEDAQESLCCSLTLAKECLLHTCYAVVCSFEFCLRMVSQLRFVYRGLDGQWVCVHIVEH